MHSKAVTVPNIAKQLLRNFHQREGAYNFLPHPAEWLYLYCVESSNTILPLNIFITHGRRQNGRIIHGWCECEACYGNDLSWYPATKTAFIQCYNLIQNLMQIINTKNYWCYSSNGEVMPEIDGGLGFFRNSIYLYPFSHLFSWTFKLGG